MWFKQPTRRYHRIDGWRGYPIPALAVIGSSDTGEWDDSPAPSREVKAEIRRFQREVLRPLGIKSRQRIGVSSNVFCAKRWVCVPRGSFQAAAQATLDPSGLLSARIARAYRITECDWTSFGVGVARMLAARRACCIANARPSEVAAHVC